MNLTEAHKRVLKWIGKGWNAQPGPGFPGDIFRQQKRAAKWPPFFVESTITAV